MILYLMDWIGGPTVFSYVSTRMILAVLTTLLINIFVGPPFIKKLYQMKIGQTIRIEDCPTLAKLHQKKKMTPTMGGMLMLFSLFVAAILWMDLTSFYTWILVLTTIFMGAIGAYDDFLKLKRKHPKGMKARMRFGLEALFAILLCLYLFWGDSSVAYFLPFKKGPLLHVGIVIAVLFSAFVIVGCTNAVNLTDGLDGLAAGTILPVALVFAVFAFLTNNVEIARYLNVIPIRGSGEIAIYLSAVAGAALGFLWYNGHPAQVFMGDTGSLALGGILGVCAVLLRREVLLAVIGGVFVAEALSVIMQVGSYKLRNKKRIFRCTPLHHHFEYKGWPETKVVLRFWIVGLILASIGLASIKFQ